jgi:4-amino-4-deoxy-L-arabinose transferase-like glycosyltransferase
MHKSGQHTFFKWLGPIVVFVLALGLRSWYLVDFADSGSTSPPLRVQDQRLEDLADDLKLARGENQYLGRAPWNDRPEITAFAAPGYFFFASALYRLPVDFEPAVRWTQCVLGALTAAIWCLLARKLFRSQLVAIVAGLLCAVYPIWIVNVGELDDGVLASFLLVVALLVGTLGSRTGGPLASLAFGLLLALLCLVRAVFVPFAFAAVLWYLWQCKRHQASWVSSVLVFLGFINGLLPWTVRNYQVFHEVVPVVDSAYYHLWVGNNPNATGGPLTLDKQKQTLAMGNVEDRERLLRQLYEMNEPERYDSLAHDIVHEVRDRPAETLRRRLWAGLCFWFGQDLLEAPRAPTSTASDLPWLVRYWQGIETGTLVVVFVLATLGWRWSFAWARRSRLITLAVGLCFLPYLLSHGMAQQGPRLPLDGILLTYAAFALVACIPGVSGQLLRVTDTKEHQR